MSVSQGSPHDDRALTRYLLGQLSEEEADRLDELAMVDDDTAWRVRTAENELVDAYVRGSLDAEMRQQFETYYLASPKRREKVRFAERFAQSIDAGATDAASIAAVPAANERLADERPAGEQSEALLGPVVTPSPSRGERAGWREWLVPRSAAGWGFAYGAAALLVLAFGLLAMHDLRLSRALQDSEHQRTALDRRTQELEEQLVEQRAATSEAERVLEQARVAARTPGASTSTPEASPESGGPLSLLKTTMALALWPQTRGVTGSDPAPGPGTPGATGRGVNTGGYAIALTADVDRVALELQLDAPDFARYSVEVEDPALDRVIWRSGRITASADGTPAVSVAVPAALLKTQTYLINLTGYGASGSGEQIGTYAFQIVRR